MSVMRRALTAACVVSLLVLALVLGLATGVDRDGNLEMYEFDTVILLAFALLVIAVIFSSGAIDRTSQSSLVGGYSLLLTSLVYSIAVVIRHPGEFHVEGPSKLAEIGFVAFVIAGVAAGFALLGGLLGAGASAVFLGCRWLRSSAWPRLGARL